MTESEALAALRGPDAARAAQAESALWAMWCRSGRPDLDTRLADAIAVMERRDFAGAETRLTALIETAPWWAEVWNKRATVRYLAADYPGSIADCRETLTRAPQHFGALAGQGLCHMALEQYGPAAVMFRRALEVHPRLQAVRQNLRSALSEVVRYN